MDTMTQLLLTYFLKIKYIYYYYFMRWGEIENGMVNLHVVHDHSEIMEAFKKLSFKML